MSSLSEGVDLLHSFNFRGSTFIIQNHIYYTIPLLQGVLIKVLICVIHEMFENAEEIITLV